MRTLEEIDSLISRLAITGRPPLNPIGSFQVTFNQATNGVKVSFILTQNRSIYQLRLKRNFTLDYGSATVLNTWSAPDISEGTTLSYDDTAPEIAQNPSANYWIDCIPQLNDFETVTVGPQSLLLNLDQNPPDPITAFDASHGAVSGGVVQVGIVFTPPNEDRFGSCLIQISGYNGVASYVDIAQNPASPFAFNLAQTGETVTLRAVSVSQTGIRSTGTAPTKSLTLGATATVPAEVLGASATELTTGVQIFFPASPESNVTLYTIYRATKDDGFGLASSIGTVAPTGATTYTFLDSSGLNGRFEWYVIATNSAGTSAAGPAILTDQSSRTSADMPINAPFNSTNFATVDSIDAGADATIRVYGIAGVGTSWTFQGGFGTVTYPAGSILHKSYTTKYWIVYDTINKQYLAFTTAPSILPDAYAFAGVVTTVAAGGAGGTGGGGGASGGSGGSGGRPLPGT